MYKGKGERIANGCSQTSFTKHNSGTPYLILEIPISLLRHLWAGFLLMEHSPKDIFKPGYKTVGILVEEECLQTTVSSLSNMVWNFRYDYTSNSGHARILTSLMTKSIIKYDASELPTTLLSCAQQK